MDELKKLREEIELLKAEVSLDSGDSFSRRMSESTTSDSISAETSYEEFAMRRISDVDTHQDSIISLAAEVRRSKDDLDLLAKPKPKVERTDRTARSHRGAVAIDGVSRAPPSLASVRPVTSAQLPRKPQMVRSGTTVDASAKSRTSKHKRTHSEEDNPAVGVQKPRRPLDDAAPSASASEGIGTIGGSGIFARSAVDLRKSSVRLDDSVSRGKLAKLLGSDDAKASKLLGVDISRMKLDSPRAARSMSYADPGATPVSPRERSATIASAPAPVFDVSDGLVFQRDAISSLVVIRGGTPSRLVAQLFNAEPGVDLPSFTTAFFTTYPYFLSPIDLFSHITELVTEDRQSRLSEVFETWLDHRLRDFVDHKDLYIAFARYLDQTLKPLNSSAAEKLAAKLEDLRSVAWQKAKRRVPARLEDEQPLSPSSKGLLSFKHRAIAAELTMIVSDLFRLIEPLDLLTQHKRKANAKDISRISVMINQFNLISNWAATEVVRVEALAKRWKVLQQLMKVALDCFDLQNYDTAIAITSGLQSAAVARLSQTFARLGEESPKLVQRYRTLETFLSSEDNYKAYRALIVGTKPPAIPFLGVFLKDIGSCSCAIAHPKPRADRRPVSFHLGRKSRQFSLGLRQAGLY